MFGKLGLAAALLAFAASTVTGAEVAAHKARMDDAQDVQYDLKDGLDAKDAAKAGKAASDLGKLLAFEDAYWRKTGLADAEALSVKASAANQAIAVAAGAGRWDDAGKAYGDLQSACRSCHDLHPEKRVSAAG